jgi:fluoroquinolone transport system permease protein
MNVLRISRALAEIDIVNVRRDALLRWVAALPLLIALAARFILPIILARLEETFLFKLGGYYPMVVGYALLITPPMLCGMVIGFLLLDERDDGTLLALRVTPLPPGGYLAWRILSPVLLSIAITFICFPLAGVGNPDLLRVLMAAFVAAPLAPLMALALATFAANKVQGFALVKATGVFQVAPILAFFISSGWQVALGLIPTYWPAKLLWSFQKEETGVWIYLLVGLIYQSILVILLLRRFNRAVL